MKIIKNTIQFVLGLSCLMILFSCNSKEQKANFNDTGIEKVVKANSNSKEVFEKALKTGHTADAIADWFPKELGDYKLDKQSIEKDKRNLGWASAIYKHESNSNKDVTLNVWDAIGTFASVITNLKTANLESEGEESNSQMRKKVYVRNGQKASEMEIFQPGLIHIIFEAEQRFYVTMRSNNNSLKNIWHMADELNFNSLK